MIRINLLASERKVAKKAFAFDTAQRVTAACAATLVLAAGTAAWRYWQVTADAAHVDEQISEAQRETARLHTVIMQVQQFEQRKAQLQQRVTLIEQLRKDQIGPVHMLDQISQALPPTVWLSEIKQTANAGEVLIDGRSLSLTGLSDFVANLERTGYFQRSVEIVSSTTELAPNQPEVIKFQIKAVFNAAGPSAPRTADAQAPNQLKPQS